MSRGILYIVWPGEIDPAPLVERSIASLKAIHPELPYHVARLPEGSTLLDKAKMCDLSPFDTTLFLDADTVVLDRLDFGFVKAERHGMAGCICECPWARRFADLAHLGDIVEWNTGVLFFDKKNEWVRNLFGRWKHLSGVTDSSCMYRSSDGPRRMLINDQASFALAVELAHFNPWTLPCNWNFRPIWQTSMFGPVKLWHDYKEVPQALRDWNAALMAADAIIDCARIT